MKIYLIRHGETKWNVERRFQGNLDSDLTPQGIKQLEKTGEHLKSCGITHLYASPSKRAVKSAEIINTYLGLSIETCDDLTEYGFGDFEGKTIKEVEKIHPGFFKTWKSNPLALKRDNQEHVDSFIQRISDTFSSITRSCTEDMAVVTHTGVIAAIVSIILNIPPNSLTRMLPDNGSITLVENPFGLFELKYFNNTYHL